MDDPNNGCTVEWRACKELPTPTDQPVGTVVAPVAHHFHDLYRMTKYYHFYQHSYFESAEHIKTLDEEARKAREEKDLAVADSESAIDKANALVVDLIDFQDNLN